MDMIRAFIWYCETYGTSLLQGRIPLATPVWKKCEDLPFEVKAAIDAGYIQPIKVEEEERAHEREVGRDFVFRWSAAEWYLAYRSTAGCPKAMQGETESGTCSISGSESGGDSPHDDDEWSPVCPEGNSEMSISEVPVCGRVVPVK